MEWACSGDDIVAAVRQENIHCAKRAILELKGKADMDFLCPKYETRVDGRTIEIPADKVKMVIRKMRIEENEVFEWGRNWLSTHTPRYQVRCWDKYGNEYSQPTTESIELVRRYKEHYDAECSILARREQELLSLTKKTKEERNAAIEQAEVLHHKIRELEAVIDRIRSDFDAKNKRNKELFLENSGLKAKVKELKANLSELKANKFDSVKDLLVDIAIIKKAISENRLKDVDIKGKNVIEMAKQLELF